MLCPNCKKEIENGSKFCEHCGARIKKSKKGLWIMLSVIFVAIITAIVVITIQEQREQIRMLQHKLELEQQLQAERKAKEEMELQAELARQEAARQAEEKRKVELAHCGLVDLGLSSGTLWRNSNEGGAYATYSYMQALERFGKKLPTNHQWGELRYTCSWTWIGNGYKITGPNGNFIMLPAEGDHMGEGGVNILDAGGSYWSSTYNDYLPWALSFSPHEIEMSHYYAPTKLSVRLVQNP